MAVVTHQLGHDNVDQADIGFTRKQNIVIELYRVTILSLYFLLSSFSSMLPSGLSLFSLHSLFFSFLFSFSSSSFSSYSSLSPPSFLCLHFLFLSCLSSRSFSSLSSFSNLSLTLTECLKTKQIVQCKKITFCIESSYTSCLVLSRNLILIFSVSCILKEKIGVKDKARNANNHTKFTCT